MKINKTLTLNGVSYDLELTSKQLDIFNRLNDKEYFYSRYSYVKENLLNEINYSIKYDKVSYKSISKKDIDKVIDIVNQAILEKHNVYVEKVGK